LPAKEPGQSNNMPFNTMPRRLSLTALAMLGALIPALPGQAAPPRRHLRPRPSARAISSRPPRR
jgi:hypothetical protein